jgi:hypothetical protein
VIGSGVSFSIAVIAWEIVEKLPEYLERRDARFR